MKEAIVVEKIILTVEKNKTLEERKSKKLTFTDDSRKDPFDLDGLQKVLMTMSSEMVDIKKQVA